MSERIDHAARAGRSVVAARKAASADIAAIHLSEAQVEATLALVEQQRIANLIALSEPRDLPNGGRKSYLLYDPTTTELRPEVREGLGL